MIQTDYDLDLDIKEMTEEIDKIIGEEVHRFYNELLDKGRDVWDTGHFFRSFKDPVKTSEGWKITNTADYSPVLARGRRTINGRAYGSLNWFNGLNPMLAKLGRDIIKRTDRIKV